MIVSPVKLPTNKISGIADGHDYKWIYNNNVSVTTFKYSLVPKRVVYSQKFQEPEKDGRQLIIYFDSSNQILSNSFEIIGYALKYPSGDNKHNKIFTGIHWINCAVVCKDKQLMDFIRKME